MTISRRVFCGTAVALVAPRTAFRAPPPPAAIPGDRFDPWVEVDPKLLGHNIGEVSRLTNGHPILAVVKNNAYGLELPLTAHLLEPHPEIAGFAVVKAEAAVALRDAGIRKPILLMVIAADEEGHELIARKVELSLYTDDAARRVTALRSRAAAPIDVQLYLDTGMGRMGMPYHRALPWAHELTTRGDVRVRGTFMAFTEEADFDVEQLRRFLELAQTAKEQGMSLGPLHAAASNGVFHLPTSHLDLVRPGIALYGGYPSRPDEERQKAELVAAFRLRARVVRVERLRTGDGVSYGRNYVAERPTWIATLPAGHSDGYSRRAVDGARVLINDRLYPAIGAVSASHTIVELGDEPSVKVGDVATFVGPDHPAIHPNAVAEAMGISVYDVLMHLSPSLPRVVV